MLELVKIIVSLLFVIVGLQLIPRNNAGSGGGGGKPTPREEVLRDPFLLAHTLDPNYEDDARFATWNHRQWEAWIDERERLHEIASTNMKIYNRKWKLNEKPINTVLIASPSEITNAFTGTLTPYLGRYVWSNRMFESYHFIRSNGFLTIYHCPPSYVAVTLLRGKPVHMVGHSDVKIERGNINYPRKQRCRKL